MCGRFMLDSNIEDILQEYRILKREVDDYKKGDIFPSQTSPIVMDSRVRTLKSAKWGFLLTGKSKFVINARSESIAEKTMFKDSFHNARCIIPANLFYEWKDEGNNNKVKHNIYLPDQSLTSLGGILKYILNDKGEKELAFVIITTEANGYMKDIHSRMPLIITDEARDYWLDNETPLNILDEIFESNSSNSLIVERNISDLSFEQMKLF